MSSTGLIEIYIVHKKRWFRCSTYNHCLSLLNWWSCLNTLLCIMIQLCFLHPPWEGGDDERMVLWLSGAGTKSGATAIVSSQRYKDMKYNAQHIANIKSLFETLLDKEPSLPAQLVVKLRKLPEKAIVRSNISVLANLKEPLFFVFCLLHCLCLPQQGPPRLSSGVSASSRRAPG